MSRASADLHISYAITNSFEISKIYNRWGSWLENTKKQEETHKKMNQQQRKEKKALSRVVVIVVFTLNPFFLPNDISSTPSVSFLIHLTTDVWNVCMRYKLCGHSSETKVAKWSRHEANQVRTYRAREHNKNCHPKNNSYEKIRNKSKQRNSEMRQDTNDTSRKNT